MKRVLVTGANGFVGSTLVPLLAAARYTVRAALRTGEATVAGASERITVGEIGSHTDWTGALRGVDLVIHLAARVHVLNNGYQGDELYCETNARGTERLAAEAARNGIRRLVYLSTVKVNGEGAEGHAYSATDAPRPFDAYGYSKWQAEQSLAETTARTGMQAVVVRSPLVYGPGVRANFLRLLRWVDRERWLPLGGIHNRRSLVNVWNLCDLLVCVLEHPAAGGQTWMVSDNEDTSTPDLVRRIARAMGRRARLLPVPAGLLRLVGAVVGRQAEIRRLCGSLTIDASATRERLGWSPVLRMDEALARTTSWYRSVTRSPA